MGVGATVVCAAAVCAASVYVVRRRMKSAGKWGRVIEILKVFEEDCATPVGKLRQVADAMTVEMHAGLASEGGSKLKMLISYVDNLPSGYISSSYPLFFGDNIWICKKKNDLIAIFLDVYPIFI